MTARPTRPARSTRTVTISRLGSDTLCFETSWRLGEGVHQLQQVTIEEYVASSVPMLTTDRGVIDPRAHDLVASLLDSLKADATLLGLFALVLKPTELLVRWRRGFERQPLEDAVLAVLGQLDDGSPMEIAGDSTRVTGPLTADESDPADAEDPATASIHSGQLAELLEVLRELSGNVAALAAAVQQNNQLLAGRSSNDVTGPSGS